MLTTAVQLLTAALSLNVILLLSAHLCGEPNRLMADDGPSRRSSARRLFPSLTPHSHPPYPYPAAGGDVSGIPSKIRGNKRKHPPSPPPKIWKTKSISYNACCTTLVDRVDLYHMLQIVVAGKVGACLRGNPDFLPPNPILAGATIRVLHGLLFFFFFASLSLSTGRAVRTKSGWWFFLFFFASPFSVSYDGTMSHAPHLHYPSIGELE